MSTFLVIYPTNVKQFEQMHEMVYILNVIPKGTGTCTVPAITKLPTSRMGREGAAKENRQC